MPGGSAIQPNLPFIHSNCARLNPTLLTYMHSAARDMRSGLVKSTLKMYDSAWSYFTFFCAIFSVALLPVNISTTCAFIVHCFESCRMQPSSTKGLVVGIQFHLRCLDPSTNLLENPSKREKPQSEDICLPFTLTWAKTDHLFKEWVLWSLYKLTSTNCFAHCFLRVSQGWRVHYMHRLIRSFTRPHHNRCNT